MHCPVAQRWCGWLLTRRLQVRALPGQPDSEGRANRHDGTRLESGRGESPAGSSPVPSADRQGCAPGRAACLQSRRQRVRLLPPLLTVSVAEQPRHRPAASGRRVRLPPDTLSPCDAAGVATCLSSRRDGFESRTGRWFATEGSRIRFAGPVSKTVRPQGREGSNPLPSAFRPGGETDITPRF